MTFRRVRPSLTLTAAVVLFAVAIWIELPAPVRFLLPLGVVAPELSAWLLIVGAVVAAAAAFDIRSGRVSGAALGMAFMTVALSIVPLVRARAAIPGFDAAMQTALGEHFSERIAPAVQARMRPSPMVIADLFRGLQAPD